MTYNALFTSSPEVMRKANDLYQEVSLACPEDEDAQETYLELCRQQKEDFYHYRDNPEAAEDFQILFSAEKTFTSGLTLKTSIVVSDTGMPFMCCGLFLNDTELIGLEPALEEGSRIKADDMLMLSGPVLAYHNDVYTFCVVNANHSYD